MALAWIHVKILLGSQRRAIDRAQIAHLPTAEAHVSLQRPFVAPDSQFADFLRAQRSLNHRVKPDLTARVATIVGMIRKIETGLTKFLLCIKQLPKKCVVRAITGHDGRIV